MVNLRGIRYVYQLTDLFTHDMFKQSYFCCFVCRKTNLRDGMIVHYLKTETKKLVSGSISSYLVRISHSHSLSHHFYFWHFCCILIKPQLRPASCCMIPITSLTWPTRLVSNEPFAHCGILWNRSYSYLLTANSNCYVQLSWLTC